jgi:hypothetical protein
LDKYIFEDGQGQGRQQAAGGVFVGAAQDRRGALLRCQARAARYLGDAAGVRVPAWMPLAYSLASFLLGPLLVVEAWRGDPTPEDAAWWRQHRRRRR